MESFLIFLIFLLPLIVFVITGFCVHRISKELKILDKKYSKIEGYLEAINYKKQSRV
jgi:hypothetical protein